MSDELNRSYRRKLDKGGDTVDNKLAELKSYLSSADSEDLVVLRMSLIDVVEHLQGIVSLIPMFEVKKEFKKEEE